MSAPRISILLPTANRPVFLRTALSSIRSQTAGDRIGEVVVSENGGDRRSAEVIKDFPDLPIRYLYHEIPTSPSEHGKIWSQQSIHELTAILHDDDWWMPEHLALALAALQQHPDAIVYHASQFLVPAESAPLTCFNNLQFWFGAGFPVVAPFWKMTRREVMLGSLLQTAASFSSLVAKTEFFKTAATALKPDNPYDADRVFTFALTETGPLLFNPVPQIFSRLHAGQDQRTFSEKEKIRYMIQTTEWMVANSGLSWTDLGDLFVQRLEACPPEAREQVDQAIMAPWCLPVLAQHADPSSRVAQLHQSFLAKNSPAKTPWWKDFIKLFLPPFVLKTWHYARKRMAAGDRPPTQT